MLDFYPSFQNCNGYSPGLSQYYLSLAMKYAKTFIFKPFLKTKLIPIDCSESLFIPIKIIIRTPQTNTT